MNFNKAISVRIFGCFVCLCSVSSYSEAPWKANAEIGYNYYSGNSNASSLSLGMFAQYVIEKWRHQFRGRSFSAQADGKTNADLLQLDVSSFHNTSVNSYKFADLRYLDDKLSGYQYQLAASMGLGRHLFNSEGSDVDLDLGFGVRRSVLEVENAETEELIARSKLSINKALSKSADLASWLLIEESKMNTYVQGELVLKLALTDSVGLNAAYVRRSNSEFLSDASSMSSYTTLTLAFNLK